MFRSSAAVRAARFATSARHPRFEWLIVTVTIVKGQAGVVTWQR
jgi:hypothetical protein